ncbi:MAG: glutamate synthase subunit beta [Ruminococcus bromii]|jgi:glutamate synthase (NADPH/NADH) small chain|nr:glutamate synthase subunit beta [Ruminococcus bromii]MEE3497631.1 glutamate synthase subunit beta [Ruminococcus bromii]HCB95328.1 glutamate synthase [Ruminococcus sp.]
MGKPTGFMEYKREDAPAFSVKERIKNYNEFHTPLSQEEQKKQGARCMECGVPFCQAGMVVGNMVSGCPLNNLIPEWNDLIFKGAWEQAYNRLKITSNFPEFTSRVCPALCEKACTCGANGDPVTVKANEYSIVENAYVQGYACAKPPKVRTGKKIAIIGSGPSGLAAADQLNLRGHSVTVFERSDRVGGLLMYGIPNMKLEKSVIDRKINIMKEEGVEFKTNVNVGKDVKASELLKNYDRVILACGASHPRDITVEGRDANGIYFAVDFLKSTTKSLLDNDLKDGTYISAKGKNVMVIGGGDTGNDCVGTSIRHGAKSVLQLEMMPKLPDERTADNPWPQWPRVCKTDYGQEEAIEVFGHDPRVYQTTVKEFLKDKNGNVKGAILVKLSPEKDKKTGRMIMTPVAGSEYKVDVELVLIAAGFLGSESYVTNAFGVETNARTNVATQPNSFKTNVDRVFTAGDMHRGQSLVVWAIREGRDAAREVDESLMGYTNL